MALISIIIVTYNSAADIGACLDSLRRHCRDRSAYEVIVVDNASDDETAALVARDHPDSILIGSPRNIGFARGCNLGAEAARGDALLFLNPDTLVRSDIVAAFSAARARAPDAGIWGGVVRHGDGRINPMSCWRFPTLWSLICRSVGLSALFKRSVLVNPEPYPDWDRLSERRVEAVSGCLLMITRALWDRLEGFDPTYFLYSEEIDLCHRAADFGAAPLMVPQAVIEHEGGGSSPHEGQRTVFLLKGKMTYFRKHWAPWRAGLGAGLLLMWASSRLAGHAVLSIVRPTPHRAQCRQWYRVWRARREWLAGYSPT